MSNQNGKDSDRAYPTKPAGTGERVRDDRGRDTTTDEAEKKHHHGATEGELKPTSLDTSSVSLPLRLRV